MFREGIYRPSLLNVEKPSGTIISLLHAMYPVRKDGGCLRTSALQNSQGKEWDLKDLILFFFEQEWFCLCCYMVLNAQASSDEHCASFNLRSRLKKFSLEFNMLFISFNTENIIYVATIKVNGRIVNFINSGHSKYIQSPNFPYWKNLKISL